MKFKIQFRVGAIGLIVEDEAESTTDFFKKVTFYHSLPETCGNCGSSSIAFDHRIAQGFQFYEIKCRACKHALRFGQYKEGAELFAKTWVEKPAHDPAADGSRGWPIAPPKADDRDVKRSADTGEPIHGFGPRRD